MTVRFRHKGCTSLVICYHGEMPLEEHPLMRSSEWAKPDGSKPEFGGLLLVECPDCGLMVRVSPSDIEPIQGI